MSTPTMQDVADLEARVEELESMLGIADGEPEGDGPGPGLDEAVREYLYYEGEL